MPKNISGKIKLIDVPENQTHFRNLIPFGYNSQFVNLTIKKKIIGSIEYNCEKNNLALFSIELFDEFQRQGHGTNAIRELIAQEKPNELHVVNANGNHQIFWEQFGTLLREFPTDDLGYNYYLRI